MASSLTVGWSFGHGGCTRTDHAPGDDCRQCGTRAGAEHGIIEADYVRELGEQAYAMQPMDIVSALQLNSSDEYVHPRVRAHRARSAGCDLVLLLHVNEGVTDSSHGGQMFYLSESQALAKQVAGEIADAWPTPLCRRRHSLFKNGEYWAGMVEKADPELYPRAHWLLSQYADMETVLVECFDARNAQDCKDALNPYTQLQMSAAIVGAIGFSGRALLG